MSSLARRAKTPPPASRPKSLRSACDVCHQSKVKCGGGVPCQGCQKQGIRCKYSSSNRTGRPKGVKNKKTLERIKHLQHVNLEKNIWQTTSTSSSPSAPDMHDANPDQIKLSIIPDPDDAYYDSYNHNSGLFPDDCTTLPFSNFFDVSNLGSLSADVRPFGPAETSSKALSTGNSSNSSPFEPLPTINVQNPLSQDLSWFGDLPNPFGLTSRQHDDDNTGGGQNSTNYGVQVNTMATVPSTQANSQPRTRCFSTCECLQQLGSQLAHFKELSRAQEPLEPDFVLVIARDALSCWQRQLQCGICQQNGDEDILVVSVMGFREILSLIHRASRPERQQIGDKTVTIPTPTTTDIHVKDGPVQTPNRENSFLGMYKLSKEERQMVVDVLLYRALENINRTVEHIKQRSTKPPENFAVAGNNTASLPSPTFTNKVPSRPSSEDGTDCSYDCTTADEGQDYLKHSFHSLSNSIESLLHTLQCPQNSVSDDTTTG